MAWIDYNQVYCLISFSKLLLYFVWASAKVVFKSKEQGIRIRSCQKAWIRLRNYRKAQSLKNFGFLNIYFQIMRKTKFETKNHIFSLYYFFENKNIGKSIFDLVPLVGLGSNRECEAKLPLQSGYTYVEWPLLLLVNFHFEFWDCLDEEGGFGCATNKPNLNKKTMEKRNE